MGVTDEVQSSRRGETFGIFFSFFQRQPLTEYNICVGVRLYKQSLRGGRRAAFAFVGVLSFFTFLLFFLCFIFSLLSNA